ncbi:hypothetical protein EBQ90_12900, partial [bacterium]|nr:hypothetical protein [bacterium]
AIKGAGESAKDLEAADLLRSTFLIDKDGKPFWYFSPYPSQNEMTPRSGAKPRIVLVKTDSSKATPLAPLFEISRKKGKSCNPAESIQLDPPHLSYLSADALSSSEYCMEGAKGFSLAPSRLVSLETRPEPMAEQQAFISLLNKEALTETQKNQLMNNSSMSLTELLAGIQSDAEKQKLFEPKKLVFKEFEPHPEHPQALGSIITQVGSLQVSMPVPLPPQPKCQINRVTSGKIRPGDRVQFQLEVDSITREGSSVFDSFSGEQPLPASAYAESNTVELGTFKKIHTFSLVAVGNANSRKVSPTAVAWDVFSKVMGVRSDVGFYKANASDHFSCQLQVAVEFAPPVCTLAAAQTNILAGEGTQVTLDCRNGGPVTSAKIEGIPVGNSTDGSPVLMQIAANVAGMVTGVRVQQGQTLKLQTSGEIQYAVGGNASPLYTTANGVSAGNDLPECKHPGLNDAFKTNYSKVVNAIPLDCKSKINTDLYESAPSDSCVTRIREICVAEKFVGGAWAQGIGLEAHCVAPILAGVTDPNQLTYGKNFPSGALLGQLGLGAPFFLVGSSSQLTANRTGNLRFYVNDSLCSGDNKGSFSGAITLPSGTVAASFSNSKLTTVTLQRAEQVNVQSISAEVVGPDGTVRPTTLLGKVCDFNNPNHQAVVITKNQWAVEAQKRGKTIFYNEDPLSFSRNWMKVSEPYTTPVRAYLYPGQTLKSGDQLQVNGDLTHGWKAGSWDAGACVAGMPCDVDNKCRFRLRMESGGNVALKNEYFWTETWKGDDRFVSNTNGNTGAFLKMLDSGNLVLYDSSGTRTLWQSNTSGAGNKLELRGNGWMGITNASGTIVKSFYGGDSVCYELPQNRYNFSHGVGDWDTSGWKDETRSVAGYDMEYQACSGAGESNLCMVSYFSEPIPAVDKDVRISTWYHPTENQYYRSLPGYGTFWVAVDARDSSCALRKVSARTGGCFTGQTPIRMADGQEKLVSKISEDDYVFNPHYQTGVRVRKVVKGPEKKSLYEVQLGKNSIQVTEDHPFLTQRGWVQALALKKGDQLMGEGPGKRVTRVEKLKYQGPQDVWNFELDTEDPLAHVVVANGIPTGDLVTQQELKKGKKPLP